jgi:two-component system cell cycle response regulator
VLSGREAGLPSLLVEAVQESGLNGRILIVDDRAGSYERMESALRESHQIDIETSPQEALFRAAETDYDLLIVSLSLQDYDALRLCSQVRSLERTRTLPILLVTDPDETNRLLRGLDLGVNDYLLRPIDRNELFARVQTQVRRKRYAERLRSNVQQSMELALTDTLTGLHNRRYLETHTRTLLDRAIERDRSMALIVVDIDYFKRINDTWGHDAGDDVLREFASRLRASVRGIDLACRYGGEEFVIVMPDADHNTAAAVGERLRAAIAREPFSLGEGRERIEVTISVGVASRMDHDREPAEVFKRADKALYEAKNSGRNRVVSHAA